MGKRWSVGVGDNRTGQTEKERDTVADRGRQQIETQLGVEEEEEEEKIERDSLVPLQGG